MPSSPTSDSRSGSICCIPLIVTSLENDGYHIFAEGYINHKPARFLIDTGASKSVLHKQRMVFYCGRQRHGILPAPGEKAVGMTKKAMVANRLLIENLEIGDFSVSNMGILSINLNHINTIYARKKLPPVDAIIGGDILTLFAGEISYHRKLLTLFKYSG